MITAEILKTLTTYSTNQLTIALHHSGYTDAKFKSAKFVGITNGGQFAYKVTFFDQINTGKDEVGKVFLTYDPVNNKITADY